MRSILFLLPALLASAQSYTISTIAGGALPIDIPGTSAHLQDARAVAVDSSGNVFFATENVVLRMVAATGVLSLVAGNGTRGFSGDDGPATEAQLNLPQSLALDPAGNLYIADSGNERIRKVTADGVISTVAGDGIGGFSGDGGPAVSARLSYPRSVAVDASGNIYIADTFNRRIRVVRDGVISTFAGTGIEGFSGDDGPATQARLSFPQGLALDQSGALYFAEWANSGNSRVRKVADGIITTVVGTGPNGYSGDGGPALSAQLNQPGCVHVDSGGDIHICDNARIRKVSQGIITTVAGNGGFNYIGENDSATNVNTFPQSIAVDSTGNLYLADNAYNRVRKIANGRITTVAGGGSATSQQIVPASVAVGPAGSFYVADSGRRRILEWRDGEIRTIAGDAPPGVALVSSGDNGPAIEARFGGTQRVAADPQNNLFVVDFYRIRKISNGTITTAAGTGRLGFNGDNGPATDAQTTPSSIAVDAAGNLFIVGDNRVRLVANGNIATVAGGGATLGDQGPATSAQLNFASGVAVDEKSNIYIADTANNRIRKVSADGIIRTVAGGGTSVSEGVPATSARVQFPTDIAVDLDGNLYFVESANGIIRIRKVSNGTIRTIAGGGTAFGDGGPAINAQFSSAVRIAVDATGNIYVADQANYRVRLLRPE